MIASNSARTQAWSAQTSSTNSLVTDAWLVFGIVDSLPGNVNFRHQVMYRISRPYLYRLMEILSSVS
ncbi:hypothetical protein ACL02T_19560 [Pseudonocardia sp. RS010]|uniref:hypothetical protein n=1 Tax=Pseudonocardia sp. RS010 TaxID=3385979 RepID=UPI0039A1B4C2